MVVGCGGLLLRGEDELQAAETALLRFGDLNHVGRDVLAAVGGLDREARLGRGRGRLLLLARQPLDNLV